MFLHSLHRKVISTASFFLFLGAVVLLFPSSAFAVGEHAFSAFLNPGSTDTFIPSGWQDVSFDNVVFATDNTPVEFNPGLGQFQPHVSGYYQLNGGLYCASGQGCAIAIAVNGAIQQTYQFNNQSYPYAQISSLVYLDASSSDYASLQYYSNGGPGYIYGDNSTYFNGVLVQPVGSYQSGASGSSTVVTIGACDQDAGICNSVNEILYLIVATSIFVTALWLGYKMVR